MPKPVSSGKRYLPGLDGLRAIAVLAVIAYHEQFGWAQGGLLGVGVFFTLSGFLITSLLTTQWLAEGRIRLGDFWLHRARRLLPALFVMLALVTAWITIADRARLGPLRGAVGAAAGYFSNWYLIAKNQSYFARFAPPAPLDHLWSLAVEEQFYLLWPLLLLGGLAVVSLAVARPVGGIGRARGAHAAGKAGKVGKAGSAGGGRGSAAPRWLVVPTLALAAASACLMVRLYQPGMDPTRVYEGTDTRAFGLLIGAALALAWPDLGTPRHNGTLVRRSVSLAIDGAGIVGLLGIGVMIWRVGEYSPFAYRGGMVLLSVATAAVVAATAAPGSAIGRMLGWRPLRWIGARSYGLYLWHYPVIVLTTPANATSDLPRAAAQTAAAVVLAALSWRFVEEPIRHGAIGRLVESVRAAGWRQGAADWWSHPAARIGGEPNAAGARTGARRRARQPLSARGVGERALRRRLGAVGTMATTVGAAGVLVVAGAGLSGAVTAPPDAGAGSSALGGPLQQPISRSVVHGGQVGAGAGTGVGQSVSATRSGGRGGGGAGEGGPGKNGAGLRTSCQEVAHIGDSTSDGLNSASYLPNPKERIVARYEDVGAREVITDIEGARSIVEVLPGGVNAYNAAKAILAKGFHGCWVLALGTDDTADVAVGSNSSIAYRIKHMMAVTRGQPVLWVNVVSLLASGPYAESNMQLWDEALRHACAKYPNMRIYDWAAQVRKNWFISDGIHYTSNGYEHRALMIADALAAAFPQHGHSPSCLVRS
jgi:peptidoglycan/LPS O-acetylase OafA/YrhL